MSDWDLHTELSVVRKTLDEQRSRLAAIRRNAPMGMRDMILVDMADTRLVDAIGAVDQVLRPATHIETTGKVVTHD